MKKYISVFIVFAFLFSSCEDENPSITETGNGKAIIKSNVEAGEIFVAGEFTGLYTPDTLELLAVNHLIKVRKNGYFSEERKISIKKNSLIIEHFELTRNNLQKNILIENFIPPNCDSCYGNLQFDQLKNSYGERIQIVNYLQENDNSFTNIQQFIDLRLQLYNVLETPKFVVDGSISDNLIMDVEERLLSEPKIKISIADTIAQGGVLVLSIFLDVYDLDGLEFEHLFLYNVITEDKVNTSADGNEVNNLLRSDFSNQTGISLSGISEKGRARFAVSEILNPTWKKENLTVISFVQNNHNKEILQFGSTNLSFQ